MKKVHCAFVREGEPYRAINEPAVHILDATPTVKWDGTACLVTAGVLYVRYALKPNKTKPGGFLHVDTRPGGKMLGWVPASRNNPAHKWHFDAPHPTTDGTYELCGPKLQTNPHKFDTHRFIKHGDDVLEGVPTDFEGLREYLKTHHIEGIVWWYAGEPIAKLKRSDFGFPWPEK